MEDIMHHNQVLLNQVQEVLEEEVQVTFLEQVEQVIHHQQVHHKEILEEMVIQIHLGHLEEAEEQVLLVLTGVQLDQVQVEQVHQIQFQVQQ